MRSWIFTCVLFLGMIGILACGSLMRRGSAVPVDTGPHFDHASHLKRGVDCADCHGGEKEEWRAVPKLEACTECHKDLDAELPPEKRAAVFYDASGGALWKPSRRLDPEIIFPHGVHVNAFGKKCTDCHADVEKSTGQATSTYMNMDTCIACHQRSAPSKNDCATCHRELRTDRAPKSHDLGWKREHGRMARDGDLDPLPKDCSICHKKSDCDTCHRAEMPANHTNFWRLRGHATLASIDRDKCRVCHTTDSCFVCHQHTKPRNHTATFGAPFNRHCHTCHLPVESFEDQGCFVCHKSSPGHASAPPRPGNAPHMTNNPAQCRICHTPATLGHPDNGQSCLFCHH
jgi:Cytochrome c7 and related cytochrome c/Cytochrome c3